MSNPTVADVVEHFKQEIDSGRLGPGDQLPSVRDLTADYGLADNNGARAVLRILAMEGYAKSIHGSGTYVLDRAGITLRVQISGTRHRGEVYGPDDEIRIVDAKTLPAPEHVAEVLGIETGAPAVRREGVVARGDVVLRASYSWHPAELADKVPALLLAEHSSPGSMARIQEATGRVATVAVDGHRAAALDEHAAGLLGLPQGTVVLVRDTTWRDDQGVMEFGEAFYGTQVRLTSEYGQ